MAQINQRLMLYWVQDNVPPRKINIERCKSNFYSNNLTEEIISAIKGRPTIPPSGDITSDTSIQTNNIKGKLFQFKYRYKYLDGEVSAWSSISKLFESANENLYSTNDLTTNNAIVLTLMFSNNLDCDKIDIAARITNSTNSDFFLIDTITNNPNGVQTNYTFRNDGQYLPIDINESNLQQDFLPQLAETQEVVNGNVLVYGNITEGYDNVTVDMEVSTGYVERAEQPISGSISMTNSYVRYDNSEDRRVYRLSLSGQPSMGDVFRLTFIDTSNNSFIQAEYIVPNNTTTITDVLNNIFTDMVTAPTGPAIYGEFIESSTPTGGTIVYKVNRWESGEGGPQQIIAEAQGGVGSRYSYKEFKQDAYYQFGVVYYDKFGRRGAVNTSQDCKVVMKPSGGMWYIQGYAAKASVSINHLPPDWAESYQLVRTKNLSYDKWLYWVSKADRKTIGSQSYIDFSIQTINTFNQIESSSVLSYDFAKGDRLRIRDNLTNPNDGSNQNTNNDLDFEILNYEIIADSNGDTVNTVVRIADAGIAINETDYYLFEIYTPKKAFSQDNLNFFWEFGERYAIITDVNGTRVHEGKFQDQTFDTGVQPAIVEDLFFGDSYIKNRLIPKVDDVNNPQSVEVIVEDPNFSDYYASAVYDEGYPNAIDDNARTVKRPTTIYYSQSFVPNSNINGLSRFYAETFEEYDRNKGDIKRLATKENYLITYQQLRVGAIPINRRIIEDLNATSQVGISQKLLNEATYYQYETGIGDNPSAFCKMGQYFYHIDTYKGLVARLSLGGLEPISDTYKMNSFFGSKLKSYIGTDKIIGYADTDKMEAIFTFETSGTEAQTTIAFSELTKGFTSFYSYIPDSGFSVGNQLYTFKNGKLWRHDVNLLHNNFYGVQYNSQIELVWNRQPTLVKSWLSTAIQSNSLWTLDLETELGQLSNLIAEDFTIEDLGGGNIMNTKEGVYFSSFWRASNSEGGLIDGDQLKGIYMKATLTNTSTSLTKLFSVNAKFVVSNEGIR